MIKDFVDVVVEKLAVGPVVKESDVGLADNCPLIVVGIVPFLADHFRTAFCVDDSGQPVEEAVLKVVKIVYVFEGYAGHFL